MRHVLALARTDRRKDRVEVAYEQLAAAEERASALTAATGVETRIIGWVHSHPHITVLPSHVDLRTQAQYQQMDSGFVGLIVAVFQDDLKQQLGRMELTAFQSLPPGAGGDDDVIEMVDEDVVLFEGAGCDHGGLPAAFAAYEASSGAAGGGGGGGAYIRKGVPIRLLPALALESSNKATTVGAATATATATADAARCVVSLQEVLLAEERFFYEQAARGNARNNGGAQDVHALYNAAVYAKALATLMEESGLPLLTSLEASLLNLRRDGARLAAATALMRAGLQQPQEEEEGAVPMETEGAGGEEAAAVAAGGPGGGGQARGADA